MYWNLHGTISLQLRIALTFKCFTLANTGLEKANQYPEMGSCFKAAFMKAACWFFTKTAIQLADAHPHESELGFKFVLVGHPWITHQGFGLQIPFGFKYIHHFDPNEFTHIIYFIRSKVVWFDAMLAPV